MKRSILLIFTLVFLVLGTVACAQPQGESQETSHLNSIKKNKKLIVGTYASYPPYESTDASGKKTGFDIDLMNEIAKRLGVQVEWVDMSFNKLIPALQEGKIDASVSGFTFDKSKDDLIDFTDPYYQSEDAFVTDEIFPGKISKKEDLASYRLGVLSASPQEDWINKNLIAPSLMPDDAIKRYENTDQVFSELVNKNIAIFVTDYADALKIVKNNKGLAIIYHGAMSSNPMNIAIPQGDSELANEFNQIIKQLKSEGFIDQLVAKYLTSQ